MHHKTSLLHPLEESSLSLGCDTSWSDDAEYSSDQNPTAHIVHLNFYHTSCSLHGIKPSPIPSHSNLQKVIPSLNMSRKKPFKDTISHPSFITNHSDPLKSKDKLPCPHYPHDKPERFSFSICDSTYYLEDSSQCSVDPSRPCKDKNRFTQCSNNSLNDHHVTPMRYRGQKQLSETLHVSNCGQCGKEHRKGAQYYGHPKNCQNISTTQCFCTHYPLSHFSSSESGKTNMVCGFENLGNTCYMSSALQCLIATRVFSNYFYYELYKNDIQPENALGTGGNLAEAFADLVKVYRESSPFSSLNPSNLKYVVEQANSMFSGYEQHDAQEFLSFVLDGLHEDLNKAWKKDNSEQIKSNVIKDKSTINRKRLKETRYERLTEAYWKNYLNRNQSFLVDLFLGQLESRLTCLRCHDFSLKFEPFMYLSLPMKSSNESDSIRSLEDAFNAFCSPENLEDAHWKCPNCKKIVPVEKRITIIKLPPILIIHLKRFEFSHNIPRKIERHIQVVVRGLNLQHLVQQKQLLTYDLYSVIDHTGGASSGHYTASCLCEDEWYRFNDTDIYPLHSEKEIISHSTYVLFYARRDLSVELYLVQGVSKK